MNTVFFFQFVLVCEILLENIEDQAGPKTRLATITIGLAGQESS